MICPSGESRDYLTQQILTYIGNKRALLDTIGHAIRVVRSDLQKPSLSIYDAFAGSGIVARYCKAYASFLIANDQERYSAIVNRCYLTNSSTLDEDAFNQAYEAWCAETKESLAPGIIAQHYAPKSDEAIHRGERAFFTRPNAILLDSARRALDSVPKAYFDLLLAPLLAEASVHANTPGVFKGFYKNRQGIGCYGGEGKHALDRICGEIQLQKPVLSNYDCESLVLQADANHIVHEIPLVDLAYFDPPYNQHPYGSNYFMLNLLADYKLPNQVSPVSGIPRDWRRSAYNKPKQAASTLFQLLAETRARYLLISYNSEGFIPHQAMLAFLQKLGDVRTISTEYNTFRGCRNLRNRALKVTEYLFLVKRKGVS